MFGTDDLSAFLGAIKSIKESHFTDEQKQAMFDVVQGEFLAEMHDPRLTEVVAGASLPPDDEPEPAPEPEPVAEEKPAEKSPKAAKGRPPARR